MPGVVQIRNNTVGNNRGRGEHQLVLLACSRARLDVMRWQATLQGPELRSVQA